MNYTHTRYFILRDDFGEVDYRKSNGDWTDFIEDAMTWPSKEFALKKAKELLTIENQYRSAKKSKAKIFIGFMSVREEDELEEVT